MFFFVKRQHVFVNYEKAIRFVSSVIRLLSQCISLSSRITVAHACNLFPLSIGKKMQGTVLQALLAALDRFVSYFTSTVFPCFTSKCLEVIVKEPQRANCNILSKCITALSPSLSPSLSLPAPYLCFSLFLLASTVTKLTNVNVLPKYALNESFMYKNLSPIGYACTRTSRPLGGDKWGRR